MKRQLFTMDVITAKASKFTGRALTWSIKNGRFSLGDSTTLGNLVLALDDVGLREVYMRTWHFGLKFEDLPVIESAIRTEKADEEAYNRHQANCYCDAWETCHAW